MNTQEYRVVVDADGIKCWYQNGKLQRTDGPAIEYPDGGKCWYQNGKPHRTDGPAVEYADGTKSWYLNGKMVSEAAVMGKKDSVEGTITINGVKYKLTTI